MPRLSEHFNLNRTQHELDFVDIDIATDTPLYLDPYYLACRTDRWSLEAHRTLRSFFEDLLAAVRRDNLDRARQLMRHLHEPNETCLGLSRGLPSGRGLAARQVNQFINAVLASQAMRTGVVSDLGDLRIFVKNIGRDKISDITTNVIRKHLIDYTHAQCALWDFPLTDAVPSGPFWNRATHRWEQIHTSMLVVNDRRLLLVPKSAVTFVDRFSDYQYHQHFVLNFLQGDHLERGSALVTVTERANGTVSRHVYKTDLKESVAPLDKTFLAEFTERHTDVFQHFKETTQEAYSPVTTADIVEAVRKVDPEEADRWEGLVRPREVVDYLLGELVDIPPGAEAAKRFHQTAAAILELMFYPDLVCPQVEQEILEGRKRIDLSFDNAAQDGFFHSLHDVDGLACQYVFIECKNYTADPHNPELDQLSGRFSPNRGRVGLLVVRTVEDMRLLLTRCRDTYDDNRGLILPIQDRDLVEILTSIARGQPRAAHDLLRERKREVMLG